MIRILRKNKKMSQQELAQKVGITRSHLQRLESKDWRKMSLDDLILLSQGLDCMPENLFMNFSKDLRKDPEILRSNTKQPAMAIDFANGAKWGGFFGKALSDLGILSIAPQKSCRTGEISGKQRIFSFILEGQLHLRRSQEYVFKESECFLLPPGMACEFYNPHQFHTLTMLIFLSCEPLEDIDPRHSFFQAF